MESKVKNILILFCLFLVVTLVKADEIELTKKNTSVSLQQMVSRSGGQFFVSKASGKFTFYRSDLTPKKIKININYKILSLECVESSFYGVDDLGNGGFIDHAGRYSDHHNIDAEVCERYDFVPVNVISVVKMTWSEKLPFGVAELMDLDVSLNDAKRPDVDIELNYGNKIMKPKSNKLSGTYSYKFR
jgi:hypothetical protein